MVSLAIQPGEENWLRSFATFLFLGEKKKCFMFEREKYSYNPGFVRSRTPQDSMKKLWHFIQTQSDWGKKPGVGLRAPLFQVTTLPLQNILVNQLTRLNPHQNLNFPSHLQVFYELSLETNSVLKSNGSTPVHLRTAVVSHHWYGVGSQTTLIMSI